MDARCRRPKEVLRMTARLSKKFYEKFGDDLTKELVDWLTDRRECFRTRWTRRFDSTSVR
jgi:hypothetical protein